MHCLLKSAIRNAAANRTELGPRPFEDPLKSVAEWSVQQACSRCGVGYIKPAFGNLADAC
eukprot:CAMPEP_0183478526 /NCGR_PEP_ID=MMETSP0370-20130417/170091_1 /TAXON_ID=268820 /ORGANISM="Peridinium aciculiferum, Strain PAER-2" /LENGTH=59 /DNA_ID=CAMNT_0025671489 /DNA_START=68 /DNA_END=245 /DNA_ORIENTATION=+